MGGAWGRAGGADGDGTAREREQRALRRELHSA
jgi:hypothetical protein